MIIHEDKFKWPCGHENEEGASRCRVCGMQLYAIGIDLGTTNSLSAICEHDDGNKNKFSSVKFAMHTPDRRIIPSVIGFDKETNEILIGQEAVENQFQNAENTVYSVKRIMGRRFDDDNVQTLRSRVNYRIVKDEGGMAAVALGDKVYTPTELSMLILKRIKEDAERTFHKHITHAVITVPAYFDDIQRQATKEAGRKAGLYVKRIVSEPLASTYAYGYGLPGGKTGKVLVFDMGGGTFDMTILRVSTTRSYVLTHEGDMWLGGDDVDERLVRLKEREIEQTYRCYPKTDARFMLELRKLIRQAKESICNELSKTEVRLRFGIPLNVKDENGKKKNIEVKGLVLTSKELRHASYNLIKKTVSLIRKALSDTRLKPEDIDRILLVGGSSLLPAIRTEIENIFPREKIEEMKDPIASVAIGAAVLAQKIKGMYCEAVCGYENSISAQNCTKCGKELEKDWKGHCQNICEHLNQPTSTTCDKCGANLEPFIDRTAHNFGIEVEGGKFDIVLPKGTPTPTFKPVNKNFSTTYNGQRRIDVPVYQGDKKYAKENTWQGLLMFNLSKGVPIDTPVGVFMSINKDRLLEVRVRCNYTGEEQTVNIIPSDWVWSLREEIKWANKSSIPRTNELVLKAENILTKWEDVPLMSQEAEKYTSKGKSLLCELEILHWQAQAKFFSWLFERLLEFKIVLEDMLVSLIEETLMACDKAKVRQDKETREQVDEFLKRAFEKLPSDKFADTLLCMILCNSSKSVNPDMKHVAEDIIIVRKRLAEGNVEDAQRIIENERNKNYFKHAQELVFKDYEMPSLLKSEICYGSEIESEIVG